MSYKLSGMDPLAYLGVEPSTPPQSVVYPRAPTINDTNFNLATQWLNSTSQIPYELVNLSGGLATWIPLGASAVVPLTLTANDATKATATSNNIDVVGDGSFITTTASGNTLTVGPGPEFPAGFPADTGGATASSNLLRIIGGANVTTSGSGNTITISAENGAAGASTFITDSGNATETGGNISILGDGTNIITSATGVGTHEVTVTFGGITQHSLAVGTSTTNVASLGVATNGQLPIGSTGADPVLATITEGSGITVTNGAGSITIAASGSGGSSTLTAYTVSDSPGTWTAQASTNMVAVIGWGGGGGGGSGAQNTSGAAGGGTGAAPTSCFYFTCPKAFFGSGSTPSANFVVGAGGAGGAAQTSSSTQGNNGTAGTVSTFGNIVPPPISSGNNYGLGGQIAGSVARLGGNGGYIFTTPATLSVNSTPSFGGSLAMPQNVTSLIPTSTYNQMGGSAGFAAGRDATTIGGYVGGISTQTSGYIYQTATGGGGGGGGNTGTAGIGGIGGDVYTLDGLTVITAGGTSGAADTNGGAGVTVYPGTGGIMFGGTGGGGGGGMKTTKGGTGGAGGFPGGGGGGGGGSLNGTNSGAGGAGADGLILVIEW